MVGGGSAAARSRGRRREGGCLVGGRGHGRSLRGGAVSGNRRRALAVQAAGARREWRNRCERRYSHGACPRRRRGAESMRSVWRRTTGPAEVDGPECAGCTCARRRAPNRLGTASRIVCACSGTLNSERSTHKRHFFIEFRYEKDTSWLLSLRPSIHPLRQPEGDPFFGKDVRPRVPVAGGVHDGGGPDGREHP